VRSKILPCAKRIADREMPPELAGGEACGCGLDAALLGSGEREIGWPDFANVITPRSAELSF
jgi:hypothetical protein